MVPASAVRFPPAEKPYAPDPPEVDPVAVAIPPELRADVPLRQHRPSKEGGSGTFEAEVPHSEVDYYASRLLSVGTDIFVDSPPELVEAIQNKAREVIRLYE